MQKISGIIWDLDNSLYPFDDDFFQATKKALAKAIIELGVNMTKREAFNYAKASYPMDTIKRLNTEFGIEKDKAFDCYYKNLDTDFIKSDKNFVEKLKSSDKKIAIISHASRDWVFRALDKIGVLGFIDNNLIMTAEDMIEGGKNDSCNIFEKMLQRMELTAKEVAMVDDKDENLKYAKKIGIKTLLITYGDEKKLKDIKYADKSYLTPICVLREFNQNAIKNTNKAKKINKIYHKNGRR